MGIFKLKLIRFDAKKGFLDNETGHERLEHSFSSSNLADQLRSNLTVKYCLIHEYQHIQSSSFIIGTKNTYVPLFCLFFTQNFLRQPIPENS